jgi:DNA-directed RNA polymerase specialized sigma24 family protein
MFARGIHQGLPRIAVVSRGQRLLYLALSDRHQHRQELSGGTRPPCADVDQFDSEEAETFEDADQLRDINTPESLLLSKQIGETVNAPSMRLPEELRTAIVLREIEGHVL